LRRRREREGGVVEEAGGEAVGSHGDGDGRSDLTLRSLMK